MSKSAVVIGGGPAGLMAAEILLNNGIGVDLYDAMPSLGRKFLMAGKSGLNLTHSESMPQFLGRLGDKAAVLTPALTAFDNQALRDWALGLGVETFVGSSGRVFPKEMKAAPLLRAWLSRLRAAGLKTHTRHRWLGWTATGALRFQSPDGYITKESQAVILALGGASWPQLGSDGSWRPWLVEMGIEVAPFRPSNSGFDVRWSEHFRNRFAGEPVKPVILSAGEITRSGEFVVTETGVEGSGIYAVSAPLRDEIAATGGAVLTLDLTPDRSVQRLAADLGRSTGSGSFANHLRKATGLTGVKAGLLRECVPADMFKHPAMLASWIKALPLPIQSPRPLVEAISTAGGLSFDALTGQSQITALPGVFVTGEMLDWEAPTGGYLLTTCMAHGRAAGEEVVKYLKG
jgi:uncharacterized flavoprotein (TIGR03862 family)